MSDLWSLGVDVAKETFTAASFHQGRVEDLGTFSNDPDGFARLAQAVREALCSLPPGPTGTGVTLTLEPTAGYELPLALFGHEQGWTVQMSHPKRVRDWADGTGIRAKTDRQDARLLARYGAACPPPEWKPLASEAAELELLLERQADLKKLIRQEKNRLDALDRRPHVPPAVRESLGSVIRSLEEALAEVDREIRSHLSSHPPLQAEVDRLLSVPGIGKKNVLPILLLLYRCAAFAHPGKKALVAYVGLDPKPHESGTSVRRKAGISRMGDRELRRLLFMGALGGKRGDNPLRAFFQRLVDRHKPKRVALIAAARKILLWAWAVFQKKEVFDPARAGALAKTAP